MSNYEARQVLSALIVYRGRLTNKELIIILDEINRQLKDNIIIKSEKNK